MTNWVVRIERAMGDSPSPEEIAKEVEASGGKLSAAQVWLRKLAEEFKNG